MLSRLSNKIQKAGKKNTLLKKHHVSNSFLQQIQRDTSRAASQKYNPNLMNLRLNCCAPELSKICATLKLLCRQLCLRAPSPRSQPEDPKSDCCPLKLSKICTKLKLWSRQLHSLSPHLPPPKRAGFPRASLQEAPTSKEAP